MSHEIITVAQMRAIDARSAALGAPTRILMENAGRAVADAVTQRFSPRPTAVLCGPGDNGGDGWVAARVLMERGWPVWVETFVDRAALKGDAATAAAAFNGPVNPLRGGDLGAELYIDALFGAGLSRPLEGAAAHLAQSLALQAERVVAVDTPSGLPGDGAAPNGPAFRAGLTVTFVRKKPAHVLAPGCALCGEVIVADIGAPVQALEEQNVRLWENAPALWSMPWPETAAHKHARGHAMIVSGGLAHTGAARLAARAALRAGAGLVTMLSPPEAMLVHAAHLTAIMLRAAASAEDIAAAAQNASALVIGPAAGVTPKTRAAVLSLLAASAPLVLDADALTVFQEAPNDLFAALRGRDVLTPHVGEFRRLFPNMLESAPTRIEAARAAAARAGAVTLLKGPDTVISAPDGRVVVNTTGAPFLATAGSGDVLGGVIAGLMAQGMESFEAACAGAWLHGRAGEMLGPGLIAEDLPEALPALLNDLAPPYLKRS